MQAHFRPLVVDKAPRYREAAYGAIKEAILGGQFEPGRPLIEEQIAADLHISRTPVREALAILQHEQLIAPRGGRGLYVREITREEFIAMFVANEAVEPYLVRQAARLATPEQLVEIKAAIERGKQAVTQHDTGGALRSGRDFHRLIGVSAGNAPLTQFVASNEERADLYLLGYAKEIDLLGLDASNREHEAIYDAVAARNPEAGERLVHYHSQSLRDRLSTLFASRTDSAPAAELTIAAR